MVSPDSPKYVDARYYMAKIESERGNVGSAARLCSEALKLNPKHAGARVLGADLQKRAIRSASAGAAPAPSKRASPPESELWLPDSDSELKDYAARKLAKARTDLWIEGWHKYPVWVRALQVGFLGIVVSIILFAGYGIFGAYSWFRQAVPSDLPIPKSLDSKRGAASKSWCMGTYEMWKSNPEFYGASTLQQLRDAKCQQYGIPPEE